MAVLGKDVVGFELLGKIATCQQSNARLWRKHWGLELDPVRPAIGPEQCSSAGVRAARTELAAPAQRHSPPCRSKLLRSLSRASHLSVAAYQVALGIATLLACVPPTLGSLHQLNAMNLLAASVVLLHALRRAPVAAGARRALWTAGSGAVRPAAA